MANDTKIYFPSLNGLRFIAASLVIIYHIEQLKSMWGLPNWWRANPFISEIGGLGVTLFFVLSGFLITYLLLIESRQNSKIDIKKFYLRRILRIWPLFYLIVLLSFFILPALIKVPGSESPHIDFSTKFILFVFLMPNVALLIKPIVPFAAQLWSVGVEEQFYLIWPHLFKIKNKNRLLILFVCLIVFLFCLKMLISIIIVKFNGGEYKILLFLSSFLKYFRIDCMAVGAIGAWILFFKKTWLQVVYNVFIQLLVLLATLMCVAKGIQFLPYWHLNDLVYSVFFIIIILNLSSNPASVISFENKILNYLGTISYGLYMFHPIAIALSLHFLGTFDNELSIHNNILIYFLSFTFSIIISGLSYNFFEKRFLALKSGSKNSKVLSPDITVG